MSSSSKEILIWGTGKIGRGFLADIFHTAGYDLSFVDCNQELITLLKEKGSYTVLKIQTEDKRDESLIQGFNVFHTEEREIIIEKMLNISLMALVVFPADFEQTAKEIAQGIEAKSRKNRQSLDILLCTNILHPAPQFRKAIESNLSETGKEYFEKKVGLIETLIMRISIEPTEEMKAKDPLVVLTNGYPELPVDKTAFKGEPPSVNGITLSENITAEEIRKIYTYNMLHATYAYLGRAKGYQYLSESTHDDEIQYSALQALNEVSQALQAEYRFNEEEMKRWNSSVLQNIDNPILKDTLDRLGADPVRKLKREDRLTGPALLCRKHGLMPYYLAKSLAYGFLFHNPEDVPSSKIQQYLAGSNIKEGIKKYCQLDREVELIQLIADHYEAASIAGNGKKDSGRIAILKKAYELGFKKEKQYRGCGQCALASLFELTGREDKVLFQAASGLSGGMALCGDGSCGGYTGGILFMGTYVGRRLEAFSGDKEAQYKAYDMSQKLHDRFVETYGSVVCRDIHNCIFGTHYCLRTKAVREKFEEAGAHRDKCTSVIAETCLWTAEILIDEGLL